MFSVLQAVDANDNDAWLTELPLIQLKSEQATDENGCPQHQVVPQTVSRRFISITSIISITLILTDTPREQDLVKKGLQGGKFSEYKDPARPVTSVCYWIFGCLCLYGWCLNTKPFGEWLETARPETVSETLGLYIKSSLVISDQKARLTSPAYCLTYFQTIIIKTLICTVVDAVQIGQSNRGA